jgi:hypothetical protein
MANLLLVGERRDVFLRIIILFTPIYNSAKFRAVLFIHAHHGCDLRDISLLPPSSVLILLDLIDQLCLECFRTSW